MGDKTYNFNINNDDWRIVFVDQIDYNPEIFGQTDYKTQTISIVKSLNPQQKVKTIIHELMHCWLWSYGHRQCDANSYHYEQVCDIVSASHYFIQEILEGMK